MMVCRLVANFLATAESLIPAARSSRVMLLFVAERRGTAEGFPFRLGAFETGLCSLDYISESELWHSKKFRNDFEPKIKKLGLKPAISSDSVGTNFYRRDQI